MNRLQLVAGSYALRLDSNFTCRALRSIQLFDGNFSSRSYRLAYLIEQASTAGRVPKSQDGVLSCIFLQGSLREPDLQAPGACSACLQRSESQGAPCRRAGSACWTLPCALRRRSQRRQPRLTARPAQRIADHRNPFLSEDHSEICTQNSIPEGYCVRRVLC